MAPEVASVKMMCAPATFGCVSAKKEYSSWATIFRLPVFVEMQSKAKGTLRPALSPLTPTEPEYSPRGREMAGVRASSKVPVAPGARSPWRFSVVADSQGVLGRTSFRFFAVASPAFVMEKSTRRWPPRTMLVLSVRGAATSMGVGGMTLRFRIAVALAPPLPVNTTWTVPFRTAALAAVTV